VLVFSQRGRIAYALALSGEFFYQLEAIDTSSRLTTNDMGALFWVYDINGLKIGKIVNGEIYVPLKSHVLDAEIFNSHFYHRILLWCMFVLTGISSMWITLKALGSKGNRRGHSVN